MLARKGRPRVQGATYALSGAIIPSDRWYPKIVGLASRDFTNSLDFIQCKCTAFDILIDFISSPFPGDDTALSPRSGQRLVKTCPNATGNQVLYDRWAGGWMGLFIMNFKFEHWEEGDTGEVGLYIMQLNVSGKRWDGADGGDDCYGALFKLLPTFNYNPVPLVRGLRFSWFSNVACGQGCRSKSLRRQRLYTSTPREADPLSAVNLLSRWPQGKSLRRLRLQTLCHSQNGAREKFQNSLDHSRVNREANPLSAEQVYVRGHKKGSGAPRPSKKISNFARVHVAEDRCEKCRNTLKSIGCGSPDCTDSHSNPKSVSRDLTLPFLAQTANGVAPDLQRCPLNTMTNGVTLPTSEASPTDNSLPPLSLEFRRGQGHRLLKWARARSATRADSITSYNQDDAVHNHDDVQEAAEKNAKLSMKNDKSNYKDLSMKQASTSNDSDSYGAPWCGDSTSDKILNRARQMTTLNNSKKFTI